ncbi:lipocalin family protein [Paludibacterium purpuratum]|uniref:Outer membrane lipoprotein Blc n=1 Tax=Paludibacterium purpuratum TaxID=1144873 RepID=A0A4R7B4U5_9NEIS|nr:lipocalin family protein [Paludibacterium purpuratum]TDR79664.1 apolipoprotein D and lipocalin family protein [Paludibacterium purpuratum]
MKSYLLATLLALAALPALADTLPTVGHFEMARFTGTWYEIAKYPNWSQRHCVSEDTMQYALTEQYQLAMVSRCRTDSGEMEQKEGLARPLGRPDSPHLEVSFASPWLSLVPAVWRDYWIIDLDARYQLAAVSDPSRQSLWILSRTPHVDPANYQALLGRLIGMGFDINKLALTPQP